MLHLTAGSIKLTWLYICLAFYHLLLDRDHLVFILIILYTGIGVKITRCWRRDFPTL